MQNDDFLYVNVNDFDISKVTILKTQKRENNINHSNGVNQISYVILYKYDLDKADTNIDNNESFYTAALRIYCPDMIVSNYKKPIPNYNYAIFPFNYKTQSWERVKIIIQLIKTKVYNAIILDNDRINQNTDSENDILHLHIPINSNDKTIRCNVKKLEGISKNNVNHKITHLDKLNELLTNYIYNNKKTASYYMSNNIIQFKTFVTHTNLLNSTNIDNLHNLHNIANIDNTNQYKVSFIPIICAMEIYYNKIKYVPSINIENKIITSDRLLVL